MYVAWIAHVLNCMLAGKAKNWASTWLHECKVCEIEIGIICPSRATVELLSDTRAVNLSSLEQK